MIQIYKQSTEYEWRFVLPQALDDDAQDAVTVAYDLSQVEDFMELRSQEFVIEDLSSPDVPSGTFYVLVTLSDGQITVESAIKVVLYEPAVYDSIEGVETVEISDSDGTVDSESDSTESQLEDGQNADPETSSS